MKEIYYRLKYSFFCLILEDDSWNMGSYLKGNTMNPLGGKWYNENGSFDTYLESISS